MINEIIGEIHSHLTSGKEKLEIVYECNVDEDKFDEILQEKTEMDIRYSSTQSGPHRDDISFLINGIDARKYGFTGTAENSCPVTQDGGDKTCKKDNQ